MNILFKNKVYSKNKSLKVNLPTTVLGKNKYFLFRKKLR